MIPGESSQVSFRCHVNNLPGKDATGHKDPVFPPPQRSSGTKNPVFSPIFNALGLAVGGSAAVLFPYLYKKLI